MIERAGIDEASGRDLWLVTLAALEDFDGDEMPVGHSIVLLAADTHSLGEAAIHRVAAKLLDAGAVYICSWGPGCERLHDLVDDAVLFRQSPVSEEAVILSTWHTDEPLEEAVRFARSAAWPSSDYEDSCRSVVVVCVDDPRWAALARRELAMTRAH